MQVEAIGSGKVAAVRDGRTLMLEDGRELRLAAIETGETSRAALEALAGGRTLRLARLGQNDRDRYGRIVGFAFAAEAPQPVPSIQAALLAGGAARVAARIG